MREERRLTSSRKTRSSWSLGSFWEDWGVGVRRVASPETRSAQERRWKFSQLSFDCLALPLPLPLSGAPAGLDLDSDLDLDLDLSLDLDLDPDLRLSVVLSFLAQFSNVGLFLTRDRDCVVSSPSVPVAAPGSMVFLDSLPCVGLLVLLGLNLSLQPLVPVSC